MEAEASALIEAEAATGFSEETEATGEITDLAEETEIIQPAEVIPVRFAVTGDSNPPDKTLPQSDVFKDILNKVKTCEPDLCISVGDSGPFLCCL